MKLVPAGISFRLSRYSLFGAAVASSVMFVSHFVSAAAPNVNPTPATVNKDTDHDDGDDQTKVKTPHSARWQVSWGVDPDAAKAEMKPVPTTIAHLMTFKRPADLPGKGTAPERYRTHRIAPVETTPWLIKGTVISVVKEHDGDYRLIVADTHGNQVFCVMPDPTLAPKQGALTRKLNAARAIVESRFHPTYTDQAVHVPVEVVSPGYFGRLNPENPNPEGFQLHPAIGVRFVGK